MPLFATLWITQNDRIILKLATPEFGLRRQRFIAPSAGGFKKRLRGIESGWEMIYNESNKAVEETALLLSHLVLGQVSNLQLTRQLFLNGRLLRRQSAHLPWRAVPGRAAARN